MFGRLKEQPPPQSLVGAQTSPSEAAASGGDEEGGQGPREGLILLVFVILSVALSAFILLNEEQDAVHDPVQKAARGEITGLDDESLLREENLRKALAEVAGSKHPLVSNIRVSA